MSTSGREYKSPLRKLVAFFEKSRDGWKAKCLEFKYRTKKLKQRVKYLTARNQELKHKVRDLERELSKLRIREQRRTEDAEAVKKKTFAQEKGILRSPST
jgi:predicted RNase H-like nuclease (RuvC/YqgF family)